MRIHLLIASRGVDDETWPAEDPCVEIRSWGSINAQVPPPGSFTLGLLASNESIIDWLGKRSESSINRDRLQLVTMKEKITMLLELFPLTVPEYSTNNFIHKYIDFHNEQEVREFKLKIQIYRNSHCNGKESEIQLISKVCTDIIVRLDEFCKQIAESSLPPLTPHSSVLSFSSAATSAAGMATAIQFDDEKQLSSNISAASTFVASTSTQVAQDTSTQQLAREEKQQEIARTVGQEALAKGYSVNGGGIKPNRRSRG